MAKEKSWVEVSGIVASIFGMSEVGLLYKMYHDLAANMGLTENTNYKIDLEHENGLYVVVFYMEESFYDLLYNMQGDGDFSLTEGNSGLTLIH